MRLAVLACLAACDRVLGLGPAVGADADTLGPCTLRAMTTITALPPVMMASAPIAVTGLAMPGYDPMNETALVVDAAGTVYTHKLFDTTSVTMTNLGTGWSHPALSTSADVVYLAKNRVVYRAVKLTNMANWTTPARPETPAAAVAPGTPFYDTASKSHMMAEVANDEFTLFDLDGTSWMASTTYSAAMLGIASGQIHDPAFSFGGYQLVWAVTGSGSSNDGIWATSRTTDTGLFDGASVQLASGELASPYLTSDCAQLYAVRTTDGAIVELTP